MQRLSSIALVVILSGGPAFAQNAQPSAPAAPAETAPAPTLENARDLAGRGRLDQAMAGLDKLAAQTPETAGVERLRGIIFYQREQFGQAI